MTTVFVVVVVVVLSLNIVSNGQTIGTIALLQDTVLSDYNKNIRPAVDQSKPVVVNFTFELVSIREVDEIMGKLSIVGILWMFWEEPRMTWNPLTYNQTFTTRISSQQVWKPDLVIAHPIDTTKAVGFDQIWYPVRYKYNGMAVWAPGDVMTTTCNIDVTYYPFDIQKCEVSFMSWGSLISEIDLRVAQKEVTLRLFTEHEEWALKKASTATGLHDGMYPTYIVALELKRRPTFVIVNVILPVVLMTLLNVLVFFLPASSGERVSFAMTVLLAISVFLTLVGANMPKTSQPLSAICYFLLTNLILSSLIMTATIFNLNIFYKDENIAVPKWMVTFVRMFNYKPIPKQTKVGHLDEPDIKADINSVKQEQMEDDIIDLAVNLKDCITWCDVSKALDYVFGSLSILWLVITTVTFIILCNLAH